MYAWLDLYAPYMALLALVLALVALVWLALQAHRVRFLQEFYQKLTAGSGGGNLEALLDQHMANVKEAVSQAGAARETAAAVLYKSQTHVQHLGLVRYNPFSHTGGDQSFVLVLADAGGHGAVINSMHSRDGTRIYAKPLTDWQSAHALTDEEREAIAQARG